MPGGKQHPRSPWQQLAAGGSWLLWGVMPVTCDFCGREAPDGEQPLTWTTAVENGRDKVFCDGCSREHLRAIESKLDSDWW